MEQYRLFVSTFVSVKHIDELCKLRSSVVVFDSRFKKIASSIIVIIIYHINDRKIQQCLMITTRYAKYSLIPCVVISEYLSGY